MMIMTNKALSESPCMMQREASACGEETDEVGEICGGEGH